MRPWTTTRRWRVSSSMAAWLMSSLPGQRDQRPEAPRLAVFCAVRIPIGGIAGTAQAGHLDLLHALLPQQMLVGRPQVKARPFRPGGQVPVGRFAKGAAERVDDFW